MKIPNPISLHVYHSYFFNSAVRDKGHATAMEHLKKKNQPLTDFSH